MKPAPFRGLNAILFKEFITVLRDPMTLFFMLFPPLVEMIAFGYALDNDVKHMALVGFDQDRTHGSRELGDRPGNWSIASSTRRLCALSEKSRAWLKCPPSFGAAKRSPVCRFRRTSAATC